MLYHPILHGAQAPHPLDADNDPSGDLQRIEASLARIANADDLALVSSVLEDLADASELMHERRDHPKITFFGSARIGRDHPSWQQCHDLAAMLADDGYTIVTGGGPGVMSAALEGAGPANAIGVAIELPFEQPGEHGFPVVFLERFLTRKLTMVRHVRGFVCGSGGMGTLDELLEVLTLLQTGKKRPAPVVLLECDGSRQWEAFDQMVRDELVPHGLARDSDRSLYTVCHSGEEAREVIRRFYSRYVRCGPDSVDPASWAVWTSTPVTADEAERWSSEFADVAPRGMSAVDDAHGTRLRFGFDLRGWGRLRELIDAVNGGGRGEG